MSAWVRRHVREEALAEVAGSDQVRAQLSPSDRQHLETCDRCQGLIEGHRRATRVLESSWRFVTAGELSAERRVERVSGGVSVSWAAGPFRLSTSIMAAILALLLVGLIGGALLVGAIPGPVPVPLAAIPVASATPTPTPTASPTATVRPTPRIIDTSTWLSFESAHYGLAMSRPSDWTATPASIKWDLDVDQDATRFTLSTDRVALADPAATFAAYGMTIPDGMTSDGFIEAYRAQNVATSGSVCFPPTSDWELVTIDGRAARLVQGCNYYVEAIVVVDRRIYIFSGYDGLAVDRPMFEAILSTIQLHPADADDDPFPASPSPGS